MDLKVLSKIKEIVGEQNVIEDEEGKKCYAYDARCEGATPALVVFPTKKEHVRDILLLANEYLFPVIPRGAGSGVTGGGIAENGGVVLSFTRMDRIIEIDRENLIAIVEPGVNTYRFQEEVKKYGLFYPPDPSSYKYSTIGGNVAECAGGPNSLKYGVTRDYVLGLEVVLPEGKILNTGVKTKKGVVGYDLTRLFVGSEGTLCVITKIVLKLLPLPEEKATILALFFSIDEAARAVSHIIRSKILPSALEFMDKASLRALQMSHPLGIPEEIGALLIIEVDGAKGAVDVQKERVISVLKEEGAREISATKDENEAEKLWHARRILSQATYNLAPMKIAEDVVVPQSTIPEFVKYLEGLSERLQIPILSYGHAGDGNFHVSIMIRDEKEKEKAEGAVREIFKKTIELGGTLSGEHGVGITKRPYIHMELSREAIETMVKIKKVLDPKNILNPGKIFDHEAYKGCL